MNKKAIMIVMVVLMLTSLFFAGQGMMMHSKVNSAEEKFHSLQDSYFSKDKATRDSATANSAISDELVEIQQTPSELLRLKLVGVGKILTGIYVLLFGILIALIMMPIRLASIINQKK